MGLILRLLGRQVLKIVFKWLNRLTDCLNGGGMVEAGGIFGSNDRARIERSQPQNDQEHGADEGGKPFN